MHTLLSQKVQRCCFRGPNRLEAKPGDRIKIPRGMPHGFELVPGTTFEFVSIQSPPIKDLHTGEVDLHLLQNRV